MARTKKEAAPDLSHIHPELRRFARPIAKLVLDPLNARAHGVENLSAIEASLRDHGQVRAAVVTRVPMQLHDGGGVAPVGTIIIGNGMTEAARRLGWTYLAAIDFDGTEAEARKLALRDNRTSDLAGWHPERLLADLRGLQAINVPPMDLGWAAEAIRDLEALAPDGNKGGGKAGEDPGAQPDRAAELQAKWGTALGQLWEIPSATVAGKVHRLLCGDCRKPEDVARVMAGERPQMVWADPPYGMNLDTDFDGMFAADPKHRITGERFERVIGDAAPYDPRPLMTMFADVREQFWWGADYYADKIPDFVAGVLIVWDKRCSDEMDRVAGNVFEVAWSRRKHRKEIVRLLWSGHHGMQREDTKQRVHPTQKPSALVKWFIEKHGRDVALLFDPYHGSGVAMVAAEQTGRLCNAIEIDPRYVAVALERLAGMGLKPRCLK